MMPPFTEYHSSSDTALDLINAMSASSTGVTVNAASALFTGSDVQVSFYDGTLPGLPVGPGILLTSGDGTPPQTNTQSGYTLALAGAGDNDLTGVLNAAGFNN